MAETHTAASEALTHSDARAAAFVEARLAGRALHSYPGTLPASLQEAYAVQAQAIRLWPDRLAGWKVGRINAPLDREFGTDRLAGPIFSRQVTHASGKSEPVFLFEGGFGAVEGEIVIEMNADAPPSKHDWSLPEAVEMAGAARLGVEIASSPYAAINDHGPLVTISDFGNNNGLILGAEIDAWRLASPASWRLRTLIDGLEAGAADASSVPGGPLESFRAVLEICARNGFPLRRGMQVTTGAVTGVHSIRTGQSALIEMSGMPSIACHTVAAAGPQAKAT